MLRLHDFAASANCYKVRLLLAQLGLDFFEQNLLEPNVGTARFWLLTGRAEGNEAVLARCQAMGLAALGVLDAHLARNDFLLGERYSVADIGLYGYTHVARESGIDTDRFDAVRAWLARVRETPGYLNDLEPYPRHAHPSAARSVHDA